MLLSKWKKEWASSHTPRSNIAWECCIQWMAIPSIRDSHSDKKGNIKCTSKVSTSISCKNAHLHIMSFITTKFHTILLRGFSGVVLTNCFSSIFHFRQFSKFKKGVTPKKKRNQNFLWICPSKHYVLHYYKVSGNSVEPFQRSCPNKLCWVISFILTKFLSSKRAQLREKKIESKFPVNGRIYTLCPSYLQSFTKFCWALSEELC